ncbi:Sister chromatid cohesion protein DCC1 [Sesamum angolense]|uniref:Sister chromatid cohesion protein DCC1 n=1 Tax=Sesamum angolense TaxID=2727404 RepID=A0AAE2C6Y6_9LAMI|nr:Sister chromatid cohesion protein DCC1 [Sesamum angolense]
MDIIDPQSGCSGGAEAVLGLQPNSSISIAYHSLFGPHNDLLLLEVDEKFLPEILHQRVTLRGQPDEDAVLCTVSKTYAVKFVGTSNSVFLIPPTDKVSDLCNNKDDNMVVSSVIKVAPGCMELVEVAPKLDKLKLLLSQNPYGFSETSDMDISEEREKTRIDEVVGVLETDGFPRNIATHCLQVYCCKVDEGVGLSSTLKLDERRICVHLAREILKEGKMKIEIFMEKWTRKVPDGMHASFDMLEGEVLIEKLGMGTWVYSFSVSSLPSTPAERFSVLFQERAKWEWKDLQPYVRSDTASPLPCFLFLSFTLFYLPDKRHFATVVLIS